jgi:GNAT superfamily N-acetyltransferase
MQPTASTPTSGEVTLREVEPRDADACAQICFEAFGLIDDHHSFPRDFPALEAATGLMAAWIPHPQVWGVVAESDGRVLGSNFLDERDPVAGVGPITVDPGAQNSGVGRMLMEAVLERGRDARSIRLLQDAFHMRSLSLYTKLGFDVTASCVVMSGTPRDGAVAGVEVRPVTQEDLEECGALYERVHGFGRNGALRDAIHAPLAPFLARRDGRVTAYAASVNAWVMNHGAAQTEEDMRALLLGAAAASTEPLSLLVPLQSGLLRWSLEQGLRALKPMNLMARGDYGEPRGAWFPSVIY